MAEIELTPNSLIVHIKGFDRVLALKSQVEIQITHIISANRLWAGIKALGTHLPGVVTAGSFYQKDGWVFFDVHHIEKAITINLADESYRKLVVEVDDPVATVAAIQRVIG